MHQSLIPAHTYVHVHNQPRHFVALVKDTRDTGSTICSTRASETPRKILWVIPIARACGYVKALISAH